MAWFKHGKTLVTFAGHIITATAVFFLVGLGVCGLHWMRELFGTFGIGDVFLLGIEALEAILFLCDFIATAVWAVMSTIKVIRELKDDDE